MYCEDRNRTADRINNCSDRPQFIDFRMASVSLFLVGDVMLARGMDMIQEHSCDPVLHEGNGLCAHDYVQLAVSRHGPLPEKSRRGPKYVWGDALKVLDEQNPDVRIINLETSVTTSDTPWPRKSIHYRMHPGNVDVIQAAKVDCCVLANNHTADWGIKGLEETLRTLDDSNLVYAGAGFSADQAQAPAIFDLPGNRRVLVFAAGHVSSGIPETWQAGHQQPGLTLIDIHNVSKAVGDVKERIRKHRRRQGDVCVLSLHWGGNWGFDIEPAFRKFAHAVIKEAGVDVLHGHSSHHVRGIEVYRGKLVIYGCGDFLNDYEGITGEEVYRGELALMYFVELDSASGKLRGLRMVPTQTKHLRVNLAPDEGIQWLQKTMSRECRKLGCDTQIVGKELHLRFEQG